MLNQISIWLSQTFNTENKKGYNGNELQNQEFADGSGLEFYDFNARTYDQQIGRFLQIDPMTDEGNQEGLSPCHFSYNNPIRFNDPDGEFPEGCCSLDDLVDGAKNIVRQTVMVVGGAVNAWSSNQIGGIGRTNVDGQSGLTDTDKQSAKLGQKIGDAVSIVTGAIEGIGGGGSIALSGGGTTAIAVPVVLHGSTSILSGSRNLIKSNSANGNNSNSSGVKNKSTSNVIPKQSKVEKATKIESVGGKYTKTTDVRPGRGPGQSRAEYVRYKNADGRVIKTQKFTYDRANKFQHKKPLRDDCS